MSDLSAVEQAKLESVLGMASGYVLNFSDTTFSQFVARSVSRDIFDAAYQYGSGSKANRLRGFWQVESNYVVGRLLSDLLDVAVQSNESLDSNRTFQECRRTAERLVNASAGEDLEQVSDDLSGPEFELILRAVRDVIERNEPDLGIDRLHTLTTKYIRVLCERCGLDASRDKPLHAIFGEYIKALRSAGMVESEMTERILKTAIGTLEAFNSVRNEQSLAHDNPVLTLEEATFIFGHVCGLLRFVRAVEARRSGTATS